MFFSSFSKMSVANLVTMWSLHDASWRLRGLEAGEQVAGRTQS